MMMTEKYYTLPSSPSSSSSSSSSSSFCYSTLYQPSTANRIREIKTRLDCQKRTSAIYESTRMKLLIDSQPAVRTHSLYDVQERIDYFENKTLPDEQENKSQEKVLSNPSSTSSAETLQSVIANTLQQTFCKAESYGSALSRTMMNSTVGEHSIGKRRSLSSGNIFASNDQKRFNRYCSSLSKRVRTCSLSNHLTMAITAITSFSEEQPTEPQETNSIDYENTYFYPEEATRLDDGLSLTTITSNIPARRTNRQRDASVCSDTTVFQSDTDENSEAAAPTSQQRADTYDIIMPLDLQNDSTAANDDQIIRIRLSLTPPEPDFSGVVHATKYTVVKDCLSDYDNINHPSERETKIRSNVDDVSLNKSMTSSVPPHDRSRRTSIDEQQNQQEKRRTNDHINEQNRVDQQAIVHSIKMTDGVETVTQSEHDDDDDGHYSDESNCSDDFRYSSDAARNSCASDDLNNTSSTLRQEAISITRVRCKRRKTWIRSPSSPTRSPNENLKPAGYLQQRRLKRNLVHPFLSNNQIDETDACQNASLNAPTPAKTVASLPHNPARVDKAMLLHNQSHNCANNNQNKHGDTPSYDFTPLNANQQAIKTDDSLLLHAAYQDAPSPKTNNKTDEFYSTSLSPIKHLLNDSIDSNIEIIQMDEQECILEIVNGVLTIVPKEKSTSLSSSTGSSERDKRREQTSSNYRASKHSKPRSSSITSSNSTPSLSEHEQERDESLSLSSSRPYAVVRDIAPARPTQRHRPVEVLDLFSTPTPSTHSTSKSQKRSPNDSYSSTSSHSVQTSERKRISTSIPRSSSPIRQKSRSSASKDTSSSSVENQTRSNKSSLLTQLLQTVKKSSPTNEAEIETPKTTYPTPKIESAPAPKPINKDRINEFASLLSSSVHLSQPQAVQKPAASKSKSASKRFDGQSSSSVLPASSEYESQHPVKHHQSDDTQTKKHIDARYNERLDDRGSIKVKTANIKALFEQKISDTNRALSQSTEHLLHPPEVKQHHKKIPISYGSLKRNLPNQQPTLPHSTRRQSHQETPTMNKYTDHVAGTKDVVIEDKQPETSRSNHVRRGTTDSVIYSTMDSSLDSPISPTNGYYSESLIAREIRETKEKEDELKRQRKKCGFPEDGSAIMSHSTNDSIKSESFSSTNQPVRSSSFMSNLDFFATKSNHSQVESQSTISSPRRSIISTQNLVFEPHEDVRQMTNGVSQELHRFNDHGMPVLRTNSTTNGLLYRSSSNQVLTTQNTNNIVQREIEAIRAKEAELRQLGRIQHTSDEHADPRKYQEHVSTLPKSQSIQTISTSKTRRDSENQSMSRSAATMNGYSKPKTNNHSNNTAQSAIRPKLHSPNPVASAVSAANKSDDYSKLSSADRLKFEKRQCQEREQELRKQRNSISASTSSTNTTINGDSGNVSQEEHDDDQERYFDKIERLKRTENEKAQAPLVRPTKKFEMSQKWEQMMANKIAD